MATQRIHSNCRNIATLRVPCELINVDSPQRIDLLKEGVQIRSSDEILGNGSFGTVVKAVYKGKQVAMKIIDNLNVEKKATIKNEANILGWDHRNVIKLLKTKIDSGPRQAVIIMERFPGQCLQHVLDQIRIPLYHIIRICLDISNALSYCHEQRLLHLDVKPKNILIALPNAVDSSDLSYECKLCDFGSSVILTDNVQHITPRGTVRYMAPELLQNLEASTSVDIYSFGITMWQLRTGRDPYFWITDNEAVVYNVIKNNLRPDSNPSRYRAEALSSPRKNELCSCQHVSLEKGINRVRILRRSASPLPNTETRKRVPFLNLNRTFNSLVNSPRKVEKEMPTSKQTSHEIRFTLNDGEYGRDLSLHEIFYKKEPLKPVEVEKEFEKLYRNCWDSSAANRPIGVRIQQILSDILKRF